MSRSTVQSLEFKGISRSSIWYAPGISVRNLSTTLDNFNFDADSRACCGMAFVAKEIFVMFADCVDAFSILQQTSSPQELLTNLWMNMCHTDHTVSSTEVKFMTLLLKQFSKISFLLH
ncbi:unnamed protein product [Lepeophtheirus salmonis]|uniref:(salmon louse) hypothetical protein n=1 Tax=Lepeophtheirus salmonis TaxID=72036 RepID=A0A7R8CG21_LEPSM|nr:unnamed protein product [Lepeophtheirus salmonis]CAF2811766.1 unnamed protein product [Lepeophtheirus salmonis]